MVSVAGFAMVSFERVLKYLSGKRPWASWMRHDMLGTARRFPKCKAGRFSCFLNDFEMFFFLNYHLVLKCCFNVIPLFLLFLIRFCGWFLMLLRF